MDVLLLKIWLLALYQAVWKYILKFSWLKLASCFLFEGGEEGEKEDWIGRRVKETDKKGQYMTTEPANLLFQTMLRWNTKMSQGMELCERKRERLEEKKKLRQEEEWHKGSEDEHTKGGTMTLSKKRKCHFNDNTMTEFPFIRPGQDNTIVHYTPCNSFFFF